jgi:hypothetical protein
VASEEGARHERAWTLPAAAGLAAVESTVAIAVLLFDGRPNAGIYIAVLAAKYPVCWALLRRQAWAYLALLVWEFTVAVAALIAPGVPMPLRIVELVFAATVMALLFASTHLFPRAELPKR